MEQMSFVMKLSIVFSAISSFSRVVVPAWSNQLGRFDKELLRRLKIYRRNFLKSNSRPPL